MHAGRARVVGPADGVVGSLGAIGVRFLLGAADTGGGFALVEHPLPPRTLAAPLHRHSREDEYSFVLEGRLGALLGDELVFGEPGDLVCKPRNQWHTFWNAGDAPARILEIISPAGFERFFEALTRIVGRPDPSDPAPVLALAATYGLELDVESVPRLLEQHGLRFD
jgi:mannose-6-phosphate isomerase-like protein (cupin superfamily)